ncbi:MAG: HEAT repeat domain-containing protein [Terriglobia bacterium]|jgi:hypothetical protein
MEDASTLDAARRFARSLNILLKTVRLYGTDHERTTARMGTAWEDLRSALKGAGQGGLLLGVSGDQVLVDGVPLEARPTDKSFAQLLSSAGLSSINFSPRVTIDDFWRLVRAFTAQSPKSGSLAAELRTALGGDQGAIRANVLRFVTQDTSSPVSGMAAQLAAQSLEAGAKKLQDWLENPQQLLQFMATTEGARRQPAGPPTSTSPPTTTGPPPQEDDVVQVLHWLSQLGQTAQQPESAEQIGDVERQIHQLPVPGKAALTQAIMSLGSKSDPPRPDDPLLLQLGERVATRFALERYERGDMRINAVLELLGRLRREINSLREILKRHEEKMGRAGLQVEPHADILDRQFWAGLPERAKKKILFSPEAYAIPPRNIRQFVEELLTRGDAESACGILQNYAQCVHTQEVEARRKVAMGLTDLVDLYSRTHSSLLKFTLHHLGEALGREANPDLHTLFGAAFVRFSHEAAARRQYAAIQEALVAMETLEQLQPELARLLWPRVKAGNPLPDFIEEALHAPSLPEGLMEVLRHMPHATVDQVASRTPRCVHRDEWERLLEIVRGVGPEAAAYLRKSLESRPAPEAASKIALLCRLEPQAVEELLPLRLRDWDYAAQDRVVRQLANSLAPQRGRLLDKIFDLLAPAVLPEAADELGICGDRSVAPRLMQIVEKESRHSSNPYLQIKAIEALGRLREPRAEPLLRPLAEAKRFGRWRHHRELRITAVQALQKINPDWAKGFLPRCGLSDAELTLAPLDPEPDALWQRQRRYLRLNLPNPLSGTIRTAQGSHRLAIDQLSLGGGVARTQCHIKPGFMASLEFQPGLHRIRAEVLVREARPQELTFELVSIGLEDRNRLRRSLLGPQAKAA